MLLPDNLFSARPGEWLLPEVEKNKGEEKVEEFFLQSLTPHISHLRGLHIHDLITIGTQLLPCKNAMAVGLYVLVSCLFINHN